MTVSDIVHVAVAVIRNNAGQVFVTRRANDVHQGGLWEFPGGKIELGESVHSALRREVVEETGVSIQSARPLIKISYCYPDKHVLLEVWEAIQYIGDPQGKEGQTCRWVDCAELREMAFPAANRAIISAVILPSTYLVTPEPGTNKKLFLETLAHQVSEGFKSAKSGNWVQFRAKLLTTSEYARMAKDVCDIWAQHDANVMLSASSEIVKELGASGLHVSASELMKLSDRPIDTRYWFSASCHTAEEIEHANLIGVDFIVIGSVKRTLSHKDVTPMGWGNFSNLTDIAAMPAYAIGGLDVTDVDQSRESGGQGIAAISALWDTGNNFKSET